MSLSGYDTTLLLTQPVIKRQDPMVARVNDFKIGSGSKTNIRGRYDFVLTDSTNEAYKLSPDGNPRPDIRYAGLPYTGVTGGNKKVYQTYLVSRSGKSLLTSDPNLTGRLYLVVVSGETVDANENVLTTFSDTDTVDVFELVGRPVIKGD